MAQSLVRNSVPFLRLLWPNLFPPQPQPILLLVRREFCSNFSQNRYFASIPSNALSINFRLKNKSTEIAGKATVVGGAGGISDPVDPKTITNEEWATKLSPESYFCTREYGTEAPFTGKYVNHKEEGIYNCVCCGVDLFSSKSKYDSGSGWPSFFNDKTLSATTTESNVYSRKDVSYGMFRIEVLCKNCNAHLGHLFDDGPKPSGLRYCVNSSCLKFSPKKLKD